MPRNTASEILILVLIGTILLSQLSFSSRSLNDCCSGQVASLSLGLVSASGYANVNVSEAKQMIESNPDLAILEVRTQVEYDSGHIQNATRIPLTELSGRLGELDKQREILVYCASGGRSAIASQMLVDNEFSKVYNLLGGITAWINAGYWIEIIHNGDLIIDGTQMFVIENCTFIQAGNIYVFDNAKLMIRNAVFTMNQTYWSQFGMGILGQATLEISNSTMNYDRGPYGFTFYDESKITISNSSIALTNLVGMGRSNVSIDNCGHMNDLYLHESTSIAVMNSEFQYVQLYFENSQACILDGLRPGHFDSWNLNQNLTGKNVDYNLELVNTSVDIWVLGLDSVVEAVVSDSSIGELYMRYYQGSAEINGLHPGFFENWTTSNITLKNTNVDHWYATAEYSAIQVNDSEMGMSVFGNSNVSISNSNIHPFDPNGFSGVLHSNQSTFSLFSSIRNTMFSIYGDISKIEWEVEKWQWYQLNITRNYPIIAKNGDGILENVALTLFDRSEKVIWNGTSDSLGQADFDITFADNNCTDILKLEASKADYCALMNVSFLSATPVILRMRYFADLNGDGTVNIVDIVTAATAYQSTPGDQNWNVNADIDKNQIINIIDIVAIAKDYGKTA